MLKITKSKITTTKLPTIKENKQPSRSPAASLPNINATVIRTKQIEIIAITA